MVAKASKNEVSSSPVKGSGGKAALSMLEAKTMHDFGVACLSPCTKRYGLRAERMFLPLGICLVHSMFMWGVWLELASKDKPADFMRSWVGMEWVAALAAIYLIIVFIGPKLMAPFEAVDIKEAMTVYNIYQTCINAVMVACLAGGAYLRAQEVYARTGTWAMWEQDIDTSPPLIVFGLYLHFNNKFVEYLDTIFMVLRKKNEQMTFLHCWHHFLMGWAWYCVLSTAPGGPAWFGSSANSLIHVIMYGYYGARSLSITLPKAVKALVTQSQLIQFCVVATQSGYMIYRDVVDGHVLYPMWLTLLQLGVMINMFVMFFGFYVREYLAGSKPGSKNPKPAATGKGKARKAAEVDHETDAEANEDAQNGTAMELRSRKKQH